MPSLFLPRSRPWLWATAAEGGLEPAPASRFRGALPHRLNSYALLGLSAFRAHGALSPANRKFRGAGFEMSVLATMSDLACYQVSFAILQKHRNREAQMSEFEKLIEAAKKGAVEDVKAIIHSHAELINQKNEDG